VNFISLHHTHTMLVVAKPVTWTLDPNRPRKTGSRIMICSVALESPRGLLKCHQKSLLNPLLTMRFSAETELGGHFTPGALNLQDLKMSDGPKKNKNWKKQRWKMTDQIAGLENAGPGKWHKIRNVYINLENHLEYPHKPYTARI